MTNTHAVIASLCLCLSAAACETETQNETMLVGQWVECGGGDTTWTFGEDGSFRSDESCTGEGCGEGGNDTVTGTFTTDDTTVHIEGTEADGSPATIEFSFYANDTQMVVGAAYPVGEHDGVVGTWESHLRAEDSEDVIGSRSTMVLRDDNTGTMTQVPFNGNETFNSDGTWGLDEDEENPGGYELEMPQDNYTLSISFQLIDDAVIGWPQYCRSAQ